MQLKPNFNLNLNLSALRGNALLIVSGVTGALFLGLIGWLQLSYDGTPVELRVSASSTTIDLPPPLPASARARAPARIAALAPPAASPSIAPAPQAGGQPATAPPAAAGPMPTESPKDEPLGPAPDPGLVEASAEGPLPRIYAKPFATSDPRPRIAMVITGLGMKSAATQSATHRLPGLVTLSFAPYANELQSKVDTARSARHEVLIDLPMEPFYYPLNDPGPRTLLTTLSETENVQHLRWVLTRFVGYVGVVNYMGSRFSGSAEHLSPVLSVLRNRGLLYLESFATANSQAVTIAAALSLPIAVADLVVDQKPSREAIDRSLAQLEARARKAGRAVGLGSPYPITIERVGLWIATLPAKGLVVAPLSSLAVRPGEQRAAVGGQ